MADIMTNDDFERFRTIIYKESGISFSETNRSILDGRLKDQLRLSGLPDLHAYYNLISSDKEAMKELLDSVTTNLTRFFRNQPHFDTLEHYVIPEILKVKKQTGNNLIRIWSAGCSTGEEPYSIAMLLQDVLPPNYKFEILASDISLKSIMVAKQGFYPEAKINGIPENYLLKYFDKKDNGYQIKQSVKDHIRFDYHNLKNDSGQRNLDVIFCRNVIIYFDEPAQEAVINRFWDALSPHSYLFIGHSESLFGMKTKFEFIKTQWACLYGKTT